MNRLEKAYSLVYLLTELLFYDLHNDVRCRYLTKSECFSGLDDVIAALWEQIQRK